MARTTAPPVTTSKDAGAPGTRTDATQLIMAARRAAVACERPDLVDHLDAVTAKLSQASAPVVVVGQFKKGKSTLVNAIVNSPVCPTSDDRATAVSTVVHHGTEPQIVAFHEDPDHGDETLCGRLDYGDCREVARTGLHPATGRRVRLIEFAVPRNLLSQGLRLIDTPGIGGIDSAHGCATRAIVPMADGVLFVCDASQELTMSEIDAIRDCSRSGALLVVVMTKIDLYPQWREIASRNKRHLAKAGLNVPLAAVSSTLRIASAAASDERMHAESGYADLIRFLREQILGSALDRRVRHARREVDEVVSQLQLVVRNEQAALTSPERAAEVAAAAERARNSALSLRSASSRWSTVLNDGIADLTATIDHDWRSRTRSLIEQADAVFADQDPAEIGEQYFPEFEKQLMSAIADNHDLLCAEVAQLAQTVDAVFADESPLGREQEIAPAAFSGDVAPMKISTDAAPGTAAALFTALRSSYGSMVMFGGMLGMVGGAVGAASLGPLSLVAGVAVGRKAARDERARQLSTRQLQARQGIKKHVDVVNLMVTKQNRDAIKAVRRTLRDANLDRANEVAATAKQAMSAAERTRRLDAEQTQRRLAQLGEIADGLTKIRAAARSATGR